MVALPNRRLQADAAAGYRGEDGYLEHFELKPISEESWHG
jgi:hypothetical protein